jgi:hypothetical protein
VLITGNVFENNNQADNASVGIITARGTIGGVNIHGNRFLDTQRTSTMQYPIHTGAGTYTGWRVFDNEVVGQRNPQPMFFDTSTPAVWRDADIRFTVKTHTTDASHRNIALLPVPDYTMVVCRTSALGVQSGGAHGAYYDTEHALYRHGGPLTAVGPVVTHYAQASDATWSGATPAALGNIVLARVSGKAATPIDWTYTYHLRVP